MTIYQNIICIDGAAATGKTSAATQLSKELKYALFDSGSLYRAYSFYLLKNKVPLNPVDIEKALVDFNPVITPQGEIRLKKRSVMNYLRSAEVTSTVPFVASQANIRTRMREIQRAFARTQNGKVIFTGRDTGDEVFPESHFKFFFVADAEVRARRRFPEMKKKDKSLTYETVLAQLLERDRKDETRAVSPMRKPEDAIVIDTSKLSMRQVVTAVKKEIQLRQTSVEGQTKKRSKKELNY